MKHWFWVGLSAVLIGSSVALQLGQYALTKRVRQLLEGRPCYYIAKTNINRTYSLWLSSASFALTWLHTPIDEIHLWSSTTVNTLVSIIVFLYWLRQPKTVTFQHPIPSR